MCACCTDTTAPGRRPNTWQVYLPSLWARSPSAELFLFPPALVARLSRSQSLWNIMFSDGPGPHELKIAASPHSNCSPPALWHLPQTFTRTLSGARSHTFNKNAILSIPGIWMIISSTAVSRWVTEIASNVHWNDIYKKWIGKLNSVRGFFSKRQHAYEHNSADESGRWILWAWLQNWMVCYVFQ